MGISILTAIKIQTNDVECYATGPMDNGKYGMVLYLMREGLTHSLLVSVDYGFYDTKEIAIDSGNALVKEIRELDKKIFEEKEDAWNI